MGDVLNKGQTSAPGCITSGIESIPEALMRSLTNPYLSLIALAESWIKKMEN